MKKLFATITVIAGCLTTIRAHIFNTEAEREEAEAIALKNAELVKIVLDDDKDMDARLTAIQEIHNDYYWFAQLEILNKSQNKLIREAIIEKLRANRTRYTDIVRWIHFDESVALIKRTDDFAELVRLAKADDFRLEIGLAIVEKLDGKEFLENVAKTAHHIQVRRKAAEKLGNDALLVEIDNDEKAKIQKAKDRKERLEMVRKLTDPDLLVEYAMNDEFKDIRAAAVIKITDQAVLEKRAKKYDGSDDYYVCELALKKLTNQAVIAEIAKSTNYATRLMAQTFLTDQTVLADVAKNSEDATVRSWSVVKLDDQTLLTELSQNDGNEYVRRAAERRLSDLRKNTEERESE
jgi:hypothetical protein